MPIEFKSGNLFDSEAEALVNATNCVGVMGKGIAKSFAQRYPDMLADYQRRCIGGNVTLGEPYLYLGSKRAIINFPTKQHWRDDSDLGSIARGLSLLADRYDLWGIRSMAMPALGCGEGGLDWGQVRPLIVEHLAEVDMVVEAYEPVQIRG